MNDEAIRAEALTKVYPGRGRKGGTGSSTPAVDGLEFSVGKGEIFGLLGPNGAGKTTTVKMLSTLLIPTSGRATVLGFDVERDASRLRERINMVSGGERGLYYRLTGRQNLRFFCDLYRVPRSAREGRVQDLLRLVGLDAACDKRVEEYSRGMKQRLHIARGLVNEPDVLFLDEPTIGLDPEIARDIRTVVKLMAQEGRTVLLTTHNMHEAEAMCDHIGIILRGRMVARGTPSELKEMVRTKAVVEVEAKAFPEATVARIRELPEVRAVSVLNGSDRKLLRVQVEREDGSTMMVAANLQGCEPTRISLEDPTLEEAYLGLVTGHA